MGSRARKRNSSFLNSEEQEDDDALSRNHQVLLQFLTHAGMVKSVELSQVHAQLFESQPLSRTISEITRKINPLKIDIKKMQSEIDGDLYYTIIHMTGETFFPRCSLFTKNQLGFLKQILTGIALSGRGKITRIQALNFTEALTKSEAEDTIDQLLVKNILLESKKGELFLSPLAVAEFEPFFRSSLEDSLLSCSLCLKIVFYGKVCASCKKKFHYHCVLKYSSSNRTDCPSCRHTWQSEMSADTDTDSD